jgi:predicted RNase H-like nuclease (RuvC/YqgF family)
MQVRHLTAQAEHADSMAAAAEDELHDLQSQAAQDARTAADSLDRARREAAVSAAEVTRLREELNTACKLRDQLKADVAELLVAKGALEVRCFGFKCVCTLSRNQAPTCSCSCMLWMLPPAGCSHIHGRHAC